MHAQLRVAQAIASRNARRLKRKSVRRNARSAHSAGNIPIDEPQQPARLRRQLVETAAEHFVRDRVRQCNIIERDFNALDRPRHRGASS